jgi:bifunctional non-homologous end joining protein LigD
MAEEDIWTIDGHEIKVTHLDEAQWPDEGITKRDALEYYRAVAPVMLPHLKDRPLSLQMFYEGTGRPGRYRRELPKSAPEWLRGAPYTTATDKHTIQVPLIDDEAGLIWFANAGALEFHLWSSHVPKLDEPDRVVIDLDPGDEADFALVLDAAIVLQETLDGLGLKAYPKTSGGDGLHLFAALAPGYDFKTVREWVEQLAVTLAGEHPNLLASSHGSTHRGNLITIDHAQNSIGRNTAAPYTLRARPGAPVSTPLSWDEVRAKKLRPSNFTLHTVPDRIKKLGDLFQPLLKKGAKLPDLPS